MTKKHFEAFARKIRANYEDPGIYGIDRRAAEACARIVAAVAAEDNPRFDRERFLKACGLAS